MAKTCSIGFRSGEYFGRKNSLAPTERISRANDLAPVTAEIIDDDDVAWAKRGQDRTFLYTDRIRPPTTLGISNLRSDRHLKEAC